MDKKFAPGDLYHAAFKRFVVVTDSGKGYDDGVVLRKCHEQILTS
jgi:hypothetical protein